jgi:hypothetical protein
MQFAVVTYSSALSRVSTSARDTLKKVNGTIAETEQTKQTEQTK